MNYGLNLFYFSSNHPSRRFNQNVSPTSYSNDSNHSVNTHIFLLPYTKWNLNGCQVGFKNFVYSNRSCGSSGVMSLSNHARGIIIDPHIQESLAECIETPYILKILHIGVSILPREDAFIVRYTTLQIVATHHIARRPGLKMYNYSKRSGGRVLCGTTIGLHNQESLAECIETPYILRVPYFGVSTCGELGRTIQILQEDAKFTRRPDITLYRNP
jgi:hypothetical protein